MYNIYIYMIYIYDEQSDVPVKLIEALRLRGYRRG